MIDSGLVHSTWRTALLGLTVLTVDQCSEEEEGCSESPVLPSPSLAFTTRNPSSYATHVLGGSSTPETVLPDFWGFPR